MGDGVFGPPVSPPDVKARKFVMTQMRMGKGAGIIEGDGSTSTWQLNYSAVPLGLSLVQQQRGTSATAKTTS
jgi:hypothetical protein